MTQADVKDVQRLLKQLGHDPGPIDGLMGPRTRAALQAALQAALRGREQSGQLRIDPSKLAQEIKARPLLFGGPVPPTAWNGILGILAAFDEVGDGRPDTLAYVLATAWHETGKRMVPVREGFATTDEGARRAVQRLAEQRGPRSAVARYAVPRGKFGHVYYGRGHVQLTFIENYERSSEDAGVDLVENPDAMLNPTVSARVMIKGMLDGRWNKQKHGLRHYLDAGDWRGARRTVNILDRADEIAAAAQQFLSAIEAARL